MENTIQLYGVLLGSRSYLRSLSEGAAFLAASTIAIFAAVSYATVHASNYVTDFVLSRVGPFNVRFLFVYGTFTAFVITAGLLASRPNRLPFALKAMALGAKGTYIGRAFVYGLGAMGEQGVTQALQIIHKELDLSMAFCGKTDIHDVDRSILMKRR